MTFFAISCILIFFASIGFGSLVYWEDKSSSISRSWLLFSFIIAFWGLALLGVSSTKNYDIALFSQYILDIFAILIPVAFLHFVLSILDLKAKKVMSWVNSITAIMIVFSFMPWFKRGVEMSDLLGTFWIKPGSLYIVFPLYFFSVGSVIIFILTKSYIKSKPASIIRHRVRQLMLTVVFGTLGGAMNFIPQLFDVNPSAFGNIFMLLYIFFMSYAILKYNLFNTKVIATRLFAGVLLLVFLTNILRSNSLLEWGLDVLLFIIVGFVSIFLSRSVVNEVEAREKLENQKKKLRKLNKKLKEMDAKKTEFLHIATHQLRGPITAIKGYTSLLSDGDYGEVGGEIHVPLQKIMSASEVMTDTINDYMDIARIEEKTLKLEPEDFKLCALVRERVEVARVNAEERGLKLVLNISKGAECTVNADRKNITQVINALIENAIKYTKKGTVTVIGERVEGDTIARVHIKDSGIGIPKDEIEGIFTKFSRASNAKQSNVFGTGMGLFIAKSLMEANGGNIKASSGGNGEGTTFTIELPIVKG